MNTPVIRPEFPNILILEGAAYNPADLRQGVIDAINELSGTSSSPIQNGTHDFWIVHGFPSLGGASQFFGGNASTQPRSFRGFIYMDPIPGSLTQTNMETYLSTLAQEVGHYWLVPGDLKIKVGTVVRPLATSVELTQLINDDTPFTNIPLLARDNSHWSVYWQADGSPMDGICYDAVSVKDGFTGWRSSGRCFPPITLDEALPAIRFARYCDLDRLIMGVMSPAEAYGGSSGIKWMQPRLTESVESHSGLVVVFASDDQLLFGFDGGDLTLRVRNTHGDSLGVTTVIPDYNSMAHDLNGMRLRVIRQGTTYYFQAKIDNPAGGCVAIVLGAFGLNVGKLGAVWDAFDQPTPPNSASDFRDWKTVAVVSHSGDPLAVGAAVNKWKHPHLCDTAIYRFEFKQGPNEWGYPTDSVPPPIPPLVVIEHSFGPAIDEYSRVPSGSLCRQEQDGAIFRARNGQIHIIAPFSRVVNGFLDHLGADAFHHGIVNGNVIDHSPKILTRPPSGDFGFAIHAKIHRTIVTPWAGGYANNKLVFGKTQSARGSDVQLSAGMLAKQDVPPGHAYRMGFIIATRDANSIDNGMLDRLDKMRSYWAVLFADATLGRRLADTSL